MPPALLKARSHAAVPLNLTADVSAKTKGHPTMYSKDINGFSANLNSLRDFVDLIDPVLNGRAESLITKHKSVFNAILYGMHMADPEQFPDVTLPEMEKAALQKQVSVETTPATDAAPPGVNIKIQGTPDVDAKTLMTVMNEVSKSHERSRLLFNNSLISLVSAAEWFFSRLLHGYFKKHPQVAISKDPVFSYEDLTKFGSMDDARQYLLERRVEEVLRGSFSDWIKYFKATVQLSMSYLEPCMADLVEVCERRNLLVHNNGVVNKIYLAKIGEPLAKSLKLGQPLTVTRTYLDRSISLFERCCILIAAELWKKLAPADEKRGSLLVDTAFQHMKKSRWQVSEGLSYFVMNDKKLPDQHTMVGKMNYWLSIKRQGRWGDVQAHVKEEDMSARDRIFRLAWFSLCEMKDEFFELLPAAIRSEDVDLVGLESFPVFEEMRPDPRFVAAVASLKRRVAKKRKQLKGKKGVPAKKTDA